MYLSAGTLYVGVSLLGSSHCRYPVLSIDYHLYELMIYQCVYCSDDVARDGNGDSVSTRPFIGQGMFFGFSLRSLDVILYPGCGWKQDYFPLKITNDSLWTVTQVKSQGQH